MEEMTPQLYLPNGQIHKADAPPVDFRTPFSLYALSRQQIKGATPKQQDYRLYLQMYERHPIVRSAIDKIVKVATNTGFEYVPRNSRSRVKNVEFKVMQDFFDKQVNMVSVLRRVYQDLLIFGDAFVHIVPDRKRRPNRLKRLAPWSMHVRADAHGDVTGYVQKDPEDPQSSTVLYKPIEIMHFKIDDPANELYGLSPLESIKLTVTADLEASKWNKNFFMNGASTGTIFMVEDTTEEELKRVRAHLKEVYTGTENAHLPVVVTGKTKIDRSVVSHSEMGFLDGRDYLKKEILAVLDVPPAKVGEMESANRSNSKEQDKTFRNESVSPLQHIVEDVINDHLVRLVLGVKDTRWQHSESDVRDAQEQMDLHTDAVQNGIENINEVRAKMGYAPIEGGDINFIMTPTGAVPVVDLELYFRLPLNNLENIPAEAHEGHNHPGQATSEAQDDSTGPNPPPTSNVRTQERPATKAVARAMWVEALAHGQAHPLFAEAATLFEQAAKSDDETLSLAYLEQGERLLMKHASDLSQEE